MGETTTPEIIVDKEPDIVVDEEEQHAEEAQDSLSVPDDNEDRGWVFLYIYFILADFFYFVRKWKRIIVYC